MSILLSYLIGIGAMVGLLLAWALVQRSWRDYVGDGGSIDPDPLAARGCGRGCHCLQNIETAGDTMSGCGYPRSSTREGQDHDPSE